MRLERPIPYTMRYMGKAQVKGRELPIGLYDVFQGDDEEIRTLKLATQEEYDKGLHLYINGKLTEAEKAFQNVLMVNPLDKTAEYFLIRTRDWQKRLLPENWEGIEIMDSK